MRNVRTVDAMEMLKENLHPTLAPCIFPRTRSDGFPGPSYLDINLISYTMSALCKISGLLIQALWVCTRKEDPDRNYVPKHLEGMLLQLWAGYMRYYEGTAISILTESSLAPKGSLFNSMVKNSDAFERYTDFLRLCHGRTRNFEETVKEIDVYALFKDLLEALPILKKTQVVDDRFCFEDFSTTTFPYLWSVPEIDGNFFLCSFGRNLKDATISYKDHWSTYTCEVNVSEHSIIKDQYKVLRDILGLEKVEVGSVYLFGEKFQYIKNLALALAEAAGPECDGLLMELEDEYLEKITIEKVGKKLIKPEDLITILIAEYGPMTIVKKALKGNEKGRFEAYLDYLIANRGKGDIKQWNEQFEKIYNQKKIAINRLISIQRSPRRISSLIEQARIDTRVSVLLHAAGFNLRQDQGYVESINDKINAIKRWHVEGLDIDSLIIRLARLMERTFRFLVSFYGALYEYYIFLCKGERDLNVLEGVMVNAFERILKKHSEKTPGQLIEVFREMIGTEKGVKIAEGLLERPSICNKKQFNRFSGGAWFNRLNMTKHDNPLKGLVNRAQEADFVDRVVELLQFLRDGKIKLEKDISMEPVYPMVISFKQQMRSGDGMAIYNYQISSINSEETDKSYSGIKIITPVEYRPNENYFCIPRANRTTNNWWLDPLLIRCSKINGILLSLPSFCSDDGVDSNVF